MSSVDETENRRSAFARAIGPAWGVPVGRVMGARWCSLRDAVAEVGRQVYGPSWSDSAFVEMRHFPVTPEQIAEEDTIGSAESGFLTAPATVWGLLAEGQRVDRHWKRALSVYALVIEALAEGLIVSATESMQARIVRETLAEDAKRPGFPGYPSCDRQREPVPPGDWLTLRLMPFSGLACCYRGGDFSRPVLLLVERYSDAAFLRTYGHELTPQAVDANGERFGEALTRSELADAVDRARAQAIEKPAKVREWIRGQLAGWTREGTGLRSPAGTPFSYKAIEKACKRAREADADAVSLPGARRKKTARARR